MWRNAGLLAAIGLFVAGAWAGAVLGEQAGVTDPAKAGADFAFQGEYVGSVQTDRGKAERGAQIIALGGGKFRGVGFIGGLPGAGWDESRTMEAEGQIENGVLTFRDETGGPRITVTVKDDAITLADGDGKQVGTLKKVERKSPTLGAKPPAGAVVLFDGKTADRFEGGRMTDDGLLMQGATSKQQFQGFSIHLEFRTPFMPDARGQGRGNSGFYAQGRYEVQVLDSFGLQPRDNECGGIYSVGPPKVNLCLPPLSWQTYDVDFTAAEYKDGKKVKNARMTVRHNGVLIHDNQAVDHATTAAIRGEGPEPGPVYLQDHGNPVRFRNIWVVEKK